MTTEATIRALRGHRTSMSKDLKNMTGKEHRTQQRLINELAVEIDRLQRGLK